jgi:hypothetical protein
MSNVRKKYILELIYHVMIVRNAHTTNRNAFSEELYIRFFFS